MEVEVLRSEALDEDGAAICLPSYFDGEERGYEQGASDDQSWAVRA